MFGTGIKNIKSDSEIIQVDGDISHIKIVLDNKVLDSYRLCDTPDSFQNFLKLSKN